MLAHDARCSDCTIFMCCALWLSSKRAGPLRWSTDGYLWNSCPRPRSCVFSNARRNPGCSARLLRGSRLTRRAILTEVNDGHLPRWISRLKFPDSGTTRTKESIRNKIVRSSINSLELERNLVPGRIAVALGIFRVARLLRLYQTSISRNTQVSNF